MVCAGCHYECMQIRMFNLFMTRWDKSLIPLSPPFPPQSVVRAAVTTVPYVFGSVPAFLALYNVCDEDCQNFSELRRNASINPDPIHADRGRNNVTMG